MKHIFTSLILLLTFTVSSFAQETKSSHSIYYIKDSILIPTKSGIDISAVIVRKKTSTEALPVVLFYTTYYQGEGDNFFAKLSADRDYVGIVAYVRGIKRMRVNHYKLNGIMKVISKFPYGMNERKLFRTPANNKVNAYEI